MDKLLEEAALVVLEKKIDDPVFVSEIRGMDKAALEQKLLQLAKHKEEIELARKDDEELESAKDKVKELSAPYREQTKFNKLKHKFVFLELLEKFGG